MPLDPPPDRFRRLSPLLIVAAVAAAYASSISASFQFDDWNVIVNEPRVASIAAWWASMPGIRPLLKLSYALNHEIGPGPAGFRVVNIAVHALNACLAWALLRRLALREGLTGAAAGAVALFAALLFALHPVQTEAVTYVSGRSVSLSALFALASVLSWIDGARPGRAWMRWASPVLFAAALAVKETAAVVPLAILLWEAGRGPEETHRRRRLPVAHAAVLLVAAGIAAASPTYRHLLSTSLGTRDLVANLRTQAQAIGYLVGQLIQPGRLNADPALPLVESWTAASMALAIVIGAALAGGIVVIRRRYALGFGILWFFLWLAPTNSLLPRLDVANDRQLYLALLGPAWLLAMGATHLASVLGSRIERARVHAAVFGFIVVALLLVSTNARNRVYTDEVVFWEDVAKKSPWNGRAFNNLGYAYALAGRSADAEQAYRRALAIDPRDSRAGVNLRLLREGGFPGSQRGVRR